MARLHFQNLRQRSRASRPASIVAALRLAAIAALLLPAAAFAQLKPPVPQLSLGSAVQNTLLRWNGLRFWLGKGTLAMAEPVGGQVEAAVFVGTGTLEVAPPNAVEQYQMLRFTGHAPLSVPFTRAIFRFASGKRFLAALSPGVQLAPLANLGAERSAWHDAVQVETREGSADAARILAAEAGAPNSSRLLLARLEIPNHRWIEARFDPARAAALQVAEWVSRDRQTWHEIWTAFTPAVAEQPLPPPPLLSGYRIAAEIRGTRDLNATVQWTLSPRHAAGAGIFLALDSACRVISVTVGAATPVQWIQPRPQTPQGNWIYLQFPTRLLPGQPLHLRLEYEAHNLLQPASTGDDWITPAAWYPKLPWRETGAPATFHLQIRDAKHRALLTTVQDLPVWRAGFTVGGDLTSTRTLTLADGRPLQVTVAAPRRQDPTALTPIAGARMTDALNFFSHLVHPYPWKSAGLAVSGASAPAPLPGVIIMDPGSFVAGMNASAPLLAQLTPAAGVAGQWWGAGCRPASPGDAWVTEGLRGAGALLWQWTRYGPDAAAASVQAWRQFLLARAPGGAIPNRAGPLALGARRLSSFNVSGRALLFAKSAYVIYMLRQMLWNPQAPPGADPDQAFVALLHDVYQSCRGGTISAQQFEAIAARHMTPAMDLDKNHKLDWFFHPWVDTSTVPTLRFAAALAAPRQGVDQLQLTIQNPGGWRGLLPVYIFRNANQWIRGQMPVTQASETLTIPVPFRPAYVEADHFSDLLVTIEPVQKP